MREAKLTATTSPPALSRAPGFIGPLIPSQRWPLRYVAAVLVVMGTVAIRAALAPLLGTQAPLLPFVLAVLISAYLGGRGPGLFASLLTPVAATVWFTAWPNDAPPAEWVAHVFFFLLIAVIATLLVHELQRSAAGQREALRGAAVSEQLAAHSAEQLRLIADAMPVLIAYVDTGYTYLFANRLYETWFGKPRDQLVGRRVSEVLGPAAFDLVRPRLQRALSGERVFFEQEIPYTGGAREVAVHYIPDVGPGGSVRGCFALVEDVAPRKRAERALREADRRKDEFLAILAHELRNPLTPIRNVAHILSRGHPDAQTVRRAGEMLERQATQLTRLVDDLLDVARIMRGRVTLDLVAVDLGNVVDTALEAVRPQFEARAQRTLVARGDTALFVHGDEVRLCQVISNLLINAGKYSAEGATIHLTLEGNADTATLSVRDEGVGIDPQLLPQIFDLFLQGDRSLDRTQDGLGIGLTIVKHLVELHGGRVEARSDGLGTGSEFRFRLPRTTSPPVLASRAGDDPARASPRRRVLVVEDGADAGESLRELLRLAGHEVEVVRNGAQALARLDEFHADIVLLDLGLPRMDGYMVAHAIRARFELLPYRPRIVALSGHGRAEDRLSALRSGFDGHLTKPVDPSLLLRQIAEQGQWLAVQNESE